MSNLLPFKCFSCSIAHFTSHEDLYLHSLQHLRDKVEVKCWICGKKSARSNGLKKHLKKHRIFSESCINKEVSRSENNNELFLSGGEIIVDTQPVQQKDEDDLTPSIVRNLWTIAIENQSRYKIPDSGVRNLLSDLIPFFQESFTRTDVDVNNLAEKMSNTVNSVTKQNQAIFDFASYVRPILITGAKDDIYFVKLSATLKAVFKNRKIVASIMKNKLNRTEKFDNQYQKIYSDTSDGEHFRKLPPKVLPLTLFCDDANFSNANYRDQKHSIFAITLSIDDIGYEILTNAQQMDLVAICHTSTLNDGGLELIMKAIVQDMVLLQKEGLAVTYDDRTYHLIPRITSIAGDNKAKPVLTDFNAVSSQYHYIQISLIVS